MGSTSKWFTECVGLPCRVLPAVVLGLMLALICGQALGHARLVHTEPADGETLAVGADAVTLEFSESIQPRFSHFGLHYLGQDRQAAVTGENRVSGQVPNLDDDNREIELPLPDNADPGWYALDWEVLSVDGHTVSGTLRFRLTD
ncbi:MAG: copper resistance protein CopC [Wenzhouxiangellaceae bacterium]